MNDDKASLWQTIRSVLAAFMGVQSEENRQKDFSSGSYTRFVVVGLIATLCFVLLMWGVVKLILSQV